MNILEEYDLNDYVTSVIEELSTNARIVVFKGNQDKAKRPIFDLQKDHLMLMITPLKNDKE